MPVKKSTPKKPDPYCGDRVLAGVQRQITKLYGADAVLVTDLSAAELLRQRIKTWLPTDLEGMDAVFGRRDLGIPFGRLIEIYGEEGHGKSSLAYFLMGRAQQAGAIVMLIDTEESFEPEWATTLGVDINSLLLAPVVDGSCLESYFEMIKDATIKVHTMEPDTPVMVVLDTLSCCIAKEELDLNFLDTTRIAPMPRALAKWLRMLIPFIARNDVSLVFINQVRDTIGVMFKLLHTPGGRAYHHMASIRVVVRRIKKKDKGTIESSVTNVKNKLSPFGAKAEIRISPKGLIGLKKKQE